MWLEAGIIFFTFGQCNICLYLYIATFTDGNMKTPTTFPVALASRIR